MIKANAARVAPESLRAAVLDWAGTTVDFGSRAPVAAMLTAFERAGTPISLERAREPMGRAKLDHIRAVLTHPEVTESWAETHGRAPGEEDILRVYNEFLELQADCVADLSGLIPGCREAVSECREMGLRIGSSTGYTRALLTPVAERAKAEGYEPEVALCADDVSPGRPAPWLCVENAKRLGVYPLRAVVKVDDTPAGVAAGRNAGAWAVGVVSSGNEVGLGLEEYRSLAEQERHTLCERARRILLEAGAHYLIDTIAELPAVVSAINRRLAEGDLP